MGDFADASVEEIQGLLAYLKPDEREELNTILESTRTLWQPLDGPQRMAYESEADIVGYGGAAGGGKTDLLAGLALTKHKRVLVVRREKAQTEGIVQRLSAIIGHTVGYNSQKAKWRVDAGSCPLIEFGGLDNPGDERRWQGRDHDLKAFDEATEMREAQVRFILGWLRTADPTIRRKALLTFNPPTTSEGRWVIEFFAPWLDPGHPNPAAPGELRWFTTIAGKDIEVPDSRPFVLDGDTRVYDFDAADYTPEQIIEPMSRTFIPARVTDNPFYMRTGYMQTLQSMPEPLRSQMLYGDFKAGVKDDPWQVIPTAWVDAAVARWQAPPSKPEMLSMGVDVARGGDDETVIIPRHTGNWFDVPIALPGAQTPDGPAVAGQVIAARRDAAPVHIDVIGVGASPYDFLNQIRGLQVTGVNVSNSATATDKSGTLRFYNLRSQLWWMLRELFDPANNTGVAIPDHKRLRADLTAPKWTLQGKTIKVESRDDIVKRIGRSPDYGSAMCLANIDTPKIDVLRALNQPSVLAYDPLATIDACHNPSTSSYDPFAFD